MTSPESKTGAVAKTPASETSAEVLTTLAEIGEEVNASLDLDEVLAKSAALIKRHIDYEIFGVLMFDGDGSYLRHRFSIGYPRDLAANLRVPLGQGISGTAAATGHPVRVGDTHHDPRYIHAVDDVRSELAVPLDATRQVHRGFRYPEPASGILHARTAKYFDAASEPAGGRRRKCAFI